MKLLVAIALLALAVANATHVPQHTLHGPRFQEKKTYIYDVEFNVTAGVLGLSSQVSASIFRAEVLIHAISEKEHLMQISKVNTSGSVKAIDHKYADFELTEDTKLRERLGSTIKFTLENGKVTSYTLSHKDNLESKKIKKSILRSLEMYIPENILSEMESPKHIDHPILYNTTENTRYGVHVSNYMITTSPYVEFPAEWIVYNISRVDNCEGEWYPGHKLHHNFQKQGCSEVCRQEGEWRDNEYSAGCPNGYEPHQSPIKRSFSHEQSFSPADEDAKILTPEVIRTTEVHFANMYDQDMEVLIRYALTRTGVSNAALHEEAGQKSYTDLEDMESEINENEIHVLCENENSEKTKEAVLTLMRQIAERIVSGSLGDKETESPLVAEKVILLRDILSTLKIPLLEEIAITVKKVNDLQFATDEEKIIRQVWLDILPLVGTPESVKFIVRYIQKEIKDKNMLTWEAKEILEALPHNIEEPNAETISEMKKLMTNRDLLNKSYMLHSAVHMALGRVIGEVCGNVPVVRSLPPQQKSSWIGRFQNAQKMTSGPFNCPESEVSEIIKDLSDKLKKTDLPEEIAIYIETLTHTGIFEALSVVSEYAYGTAKNIQGFSPRFIDFTKSMALHALHNIAGRYPEHVLRVVLPMYFNETETPKVRNAAFGVLIRCQPSLDIFERIAIRSWYEKSYEVGSFVTSTLETFGNSSLPCMQLLSHRIKAVLPQVKKFEVGMHHAKNYMWSYFDALRDFGLEGRLEYTPNNESFIPSTVYHSLSYSMDSLRDSIWQSALNIEGWTQESIVEKFNTFMDRRNVEPIERENEVFGEGKKGMDFIQPRTVEDLRFTTYTKFFYKTAYYYMNPTILTSAMEEFSAVFKAYLRKSDRDYTGYLVKLYLPSSYHTISIAKTLPYPVEFQMRQPVVFALGVKNAEGSGRPTMKQFDLHFKPSIYMSKLFTHQMKNIGDCKEVGVYHEHKIAMTYPFELKFNEIRFPNVTLKYKVPPATKRVLWFNTESGTYAGQKTLENLPSTQERTAIKTIPAPFKFEKDINLVGVPPLRVEVLTEDMNLFSEKLPRTPTEALDIVIRRVLNAGWRYKHVKIHILENRALWTGDTEATFDVEYSRKYIPRFGGKRSPQDSNENEQSTWGNVNRKASRVQRQSDETHDFPIWNPKSRQSDETPDLPIWNPKSRQSDDYTESPIWTEDSRQSEDSTNSPSWGINDEETDDDIDWTRFFKRTDCMSISEITESAKEAARILNYFLPHMMHTLNISVTAKPLSSTAYLRMEYNHTYAKDFYSVHAEAASKRQEEDAAHEITLDHLMGFWNRPDEFRYPEDFGKQRAGFFTAFSLPPPHHPTDPWKQIEVAIQGNLRYESNKKILAPELNEKVDDMYFLPETHERCRDDVRHKNPLSPDCLKAIREYSIFNKLNMSILWEKNLPETIRQWARVADIYLKHYYFEHIQLRPSRENQKGIDIGLSYIDKLVDEPVVDLEVRKPSETFILRRIPVIHALPLSSVYSMHESWALEASNNTYPPTCLLMENYVQTYDLKTYPFEPRDCYYVLSTHCTKAKNFAVLLRGNKEIHIHVASNKIVLSPERRSGYTVKYNDRDYEIRDPVIFHSEHGIYAFTTLVKTGHEHLTVVARKAGIRVHYDGRNVKVQVSPRYKGQLCGLCSEFDGEELREFRGMDRCLYTDHVDFADSAMVRREGRCRVNEQRIGGRICDNGSKTRVWSHTPVKQEEDEPTVMRNVVISRGNEVCFSVRPVPLCEENVEPTETESQRIGFHCLPKRDLTARKLITEAKFRTLDEIERKSVDYVETIEVPKMC